MATQVSVSAILRHGVQNIRADQIAFLVKNEKKVAEIFAEMEARRQVVVDTEKAARAREAAAEEAEAKLAATTDRIKKSEAALEEEKAKLKAERESEMAALGRRSREVIKNELAATERDAGLDARERDIESAEREQGNKLRSREDQIEVQEAEAEERIQADLRATAALEERERRIATAEKLMKQAIAGLR